MSERVKVSKEVAEAIDRLKDRNPTWTIHDIFHVVVNKGHEASKQNFEDVAILRKWAFTSELLFANALLIGYEVEQTPTEQAIQWMIKRKCLAPGFSEHDIVMAVKSILERKRITLSS